MRKGRFSNLDYVYTEKTINHLKRWQQERSRKLREKDYSYVVPSVRPDLTYLHHNRLEPTLTWIGHSTFLLQHSGLNIVTDPVWVQQLGLHKRMTAPGIPIEDMPPIDVVLVSHSHYDHLSITSLRRLQGAKTLLVPAGLKSKLQLKGFMRVHELAWWESIVVRGVKFTFVPSQHWARRTPWDMNRSHWGGWVIEGAAASGSAIADAEASAPLPSLDSTPAPEADANAEHPVVSRAPTIYFAGDSGYFRGFADIGRRFAIDIAMMPIGAYEPEWFMGPQHVSPEEALQAYLDTEASWFVPMHYGSFKLADDTPREALDRLEAGRLALGIPRERLLLLLHGETWKINGR
jgi:L-ascorbate metabolism protein UlaG (beta-lactamase superfamily)